MANKIPRKLSRREFAKQAAFLSASASLVPAQAILPSAATRAQAPSSQSATKLTTEGQTEADSRYQQILGLYGDRFDDGQKARIKTMCDELQPALERIRSYPLKNGDAPALYLKPLVERPKKRQPVSAPKPGVNSKKP
jgi:hypothetical protein